MRAPEHVPNTCPLAPPPAPERSRAADTLRYHPGFPQLEPSIPEPLRTLAYLCLARDPHKRLTAAEALEELQVIVLGSLPATPPHKELVRGSSLQGIHPAKRSWQ